jgi:site-specific DNA recombinase
MEEQNQGRLRCPNLGHHAGRKSVPGAAAEAAIERLGPTMTPQALKTFARQARKRMRTESGGYRRDHLRALAQRVEVDAKEVRIMGSKSALLRTLIAVSSAKTAGFGVPSSVPKWRARRDSNS